MLRLRSFGARAVPARLLPRLPLCGTVDTLWTYLLPSESVALRFLPCLSFRHSITFMKKGMLSLALSNHTASVRPTSRSSSSAFCNENLRSSPYSQQRIGNQPTDLRISLLHAGILGFSCQGASSELKPERKLPTFQHLLRPQMAFQSKGL